MRFAFLISCVGLAALLGAGCGAKPSGGKAEESEAPAPPSGEYAALDHAQPKLSTIKLWLGDQELLTEVARRPQEIMTGMMFRTNIAENEAMLFLLPGPQRASFYMRNTKVPLSAAYLDPEGTILEIHDLQPLVEKPVEATATNVLFVLETSQGWFKRHNLGPGVVVRTPFGALRAVDWNRLQPRGRPSSP
jgi:uncharacterized membrane protein (UPF0127 family)